MDLLNILISNAYAADAPPPPPGAFSLPVVMMGIAVVFYFLLIRPNHKRDKEQKQLINGLVKGDEVVTAGGILGRVTKVCDPYLGLTVANSVEILVQKSTVVNVLPKGTLNQLNKS